MKSVFAYIRHAIRYRYTCKICATFKSVIAYTCDFLPIDFIRDNCFTFTSVVSDYFNCFIRKYGVFICRFLNFLRQNNCKLNRKALVEVDFLGVYRRVIFGIGEHTKYIYSEFSATFSITEVNFAHIYRNVSCYSVLDLYYLDISYVSAFLLCKIHAFFFSLKLIIAITETTHIKIVTEIFDLNA